MPISAETASFVARISSVRSFAFLLLTACTGEAAEPTPKLAEPAPTASASAPNAPPTPSVTRDGVPTGDAAAVQRWLATKAYKSWAHESAPHPSTGPHGSAVQTFLNEALAGSLGAGAEEHGVGAAAVKELFDAKGALTGWAFYVKTQDKSDGGKGWYWVETYDTSADAKPAFSGQGNPTCTGCHSQGRDYVRIPFPLR